MRINCLVVALLAANLGAAEAPRRPFPQHVVYAPGTIRPSHRTQAQQDDDVRAYYDAWKRSFLMAAGDGLHRISFGSTNPARTVSEGQGYGMIVVAVMAGHDPDAQSLFDGLWRFVRAHPSRIDRRLMSWQVPSEPGGSASAFDGDADIAYALLLADAQWGSDGPVDYAAEARTMIGGILEATIGPDSRLPMLGDWIDPRGATHNQFTPRSSDFMPGHFRAYAKATGDPVWMRVVAESQRVIGALQQNFSPQTGLLPDFIVDAGSAPRPAPAGFLEAETDDDYSYNAGRVPWRIGTDALLHGDPVSLEQVRRITRWAVAATGGDPLKVRGGYRLDGTPLPGSDFFSIFFAAPLGVAAMTDPSQQQWLNSLYDAVYQRHEDYYEDSVALLSLFVMSGNSWTPAARTARRRIVRR